MSMKLYSVKDLDNNDDFSDLIELDGKICSVRIVSAFFDIESIKQVIGFLETEGSRREKKEFILVVDGIRSGFYSEDGHAKKELIELNSRIRNICPSIASGIYLARSKSIFHSKGYLFRSSIDGRFIIGSLNFSQNGLKYNEELILDDGFYKSSRIANQFDKYVNNLVNNSSQNDVATRRIDLIGDNDKKKASSLREMFLDGRLYYEYKEQDPFSFDLKLPDELRQSTSNLSEYLESKTTNSLDIAKLVEGSLSLQLPSLTQSRSKWKKFCVETCYGYWSPNSYYQIEDDDCLSHELAKKKGDREEYYEKLYLALKGNFPRITKEVEGIVEKIRKVLSEEDYSDVRWDYYDDKKLSDSWEKWRYRLEEKMKNTNYTDRLTSGISSTITPDIWEDSLAVRDFEGTFFDSIIYSIRKSSRRTENWPALAISEIVRMDDVETGEDLKRNLEEILIKDDSESIFDWEYE